MCEYKDIDSMIKSKEERRARVQKEMLERQKHSSEANADHNPEKLDHQFHQTTFCLDKFLENHPNVTYKGFTNFSDEELDELITIVNNTLGERHRGKKMRITPKGCLFITLTYYSVYSPMDHLSSITSIKIPTLQRIIKKVTNEYFPIFVKKFIPKELPTCKKQFTNFPDAVGAVDSTTIEFYRPTDHEKMKKSWDGKNHVNGIKLQAVVNPAGIAIHVNIDYLGSVHDKKLFDVSGVTEFLTVKRGVRLLHHPILADRGYAGIEKYYEEAIVQRRGKDKEIIERNNQIAKDRQIVERFFGRLKMSWGILSDGFRGEKSNLQTIVLGLTALTNYLIDQHPLTSDDAPDPLEISTDDEEDNGQIVTITTIVGIHNQGLTCHLNSVLQVLVAIPEFVEAVQQNENDDCRLIHAFKQVFNQIQMRGNDDSHSADTTCLTDILGQHILEMQDCIDTYEEIITKISYEFQSNGSQNDVSSMFRSDLQRKDGSSEKMLTFYLNSSIPDVAQAFKSMKKSITRFISPPILVINLGRMPETETYKHSATKFCFPCNLDLSKISTCERKKYELFAIIAYADMHFIAFVKQNGEWTIYDDEKVYKCHEDSIHYLEGGSQDDPNDLWKAIGHKFVARLLFYKCI